jgi:hypothetical protein
MQVALELIVVSETSDKSDDDIIPNLPLAPSPRRSARVRTPRMQTQTGSLKRMPPTSSSCSSNTSDEEPPPALSVKAKPAAATKVPYIQTPPHQHTPYTTLYHAHSHLRRSRPNLPQPLRCHTSIHHLISIHPPLFCSGSCHTSIHHLISIHHTPPYTIPTATSRLVG